jgi:DHA3 family tetracycline resistance protein-like MFS transporter
VSMQPHQRQAYHAFLIWYSLSNCFFTLITTVNLVYQFTIAHLTPLQLVLVGTVLELTTIVAQIPTGVIADVFSRRRSLVVGTFLVGFGFALEGTFPTFGMILLAQILWGTGSTVLDGADAAWLADEVGEEHLERVYLRASQVIQALTLLVIPVSVLLGSVRLNLPVVLGGVLMMALALAMPGFLPERAFTPPVRAGRSTWSMMQHTLRQGIAIVRRSPVLPALMGIELFFGLASEGWDRLWQPFLLIGFALPKIGALQPVAWVGLAQLVSAIIGVGLGQIAVRNLERSARFSGVSMLLLLHMARVVGIIAFALSGNLLVALLAFWLEDSMRKLNQPLYDARFARSAAAEVRATVISLRGLVNAGGQIAGGPGIGAIGNRSLRLALTSVGALLCPIFPLLGRIKAREATAPVLMHVTPDSAG